jgi:rubrerythrin
MLAKAMEMEKKGKDYYDKAVKDTKNEMGKKIFKMLGEDETKHQQRIKEIYDKISGGNPFPEDKVVKIEEEFNPDRLKQLFVDINKADPNDIEALKMGIKFEETAVNYYEKYLPEAKDKMEKRFIKEMISEEKSHHKALVEMHYYFTDPEAWMMERERVSLDGA